MGADFAGVHYQREMHCRFFREGECSCECACLTPTENVCFSLSFCSRLVPGIGREVCGGDAEGLGAAAEALDDDPLGAPRLVEWHHLAHAVLAQSMAQQPTGKINKPASNQQPGQPIPAVHGAKQKEEKKHAEIAGALASKAGRPQTASGRQSRSDPMTSVAPAKSAGSHLPLASPSPAATEGTATTRMPAARAALTPAGASSTTCGGS